MSGIASMQWHTILAYRDYKYTQEEYCAKLTIQNLLNHINQLRHLAIKFNHHDKTHKNY